MTLTGQDMAPLDEFHFDVQPVGLKFLAERPNAVDGLAENMALCEMLKHAQEGNAFYAGVENHTCPAGAYVLGLEEAAGPFINGQFGAGLKIFDGPRAASRLYLYIPKIGRDVIKYVSFSPLDKLSFEPDVLILLANTGQAEILLRAMSYRTGQMWSSKFSSAIGCAWVLVHPYLTGELNYVATGLGHGMKRRGLFPEGLHVVSIPFDILRSMLRNLRDMPWVLPAYEADGPEYVRRLLLDLGVGLPSD